MTPAEAHGVARAGNLCEFALQDYGVGAGHVGSATTQAHAGVTCISRCCGYRNVDLVVVRVPYGSIGE